MMPTDETEVWIPDEDPRRGLSVWDIKPENDYFVGARPQQFIVEPPEGETALSALGAVAAVRSLGAMQPRVLFGGAISVIPPEFPTGTPVEVLNELGLILTDLTSEQAMELSERGYKISVNEVRYVPPLPPVTTPRPVRAQHAVAAGPHYTWGLAAIGVPDGSGFTGKGIKVAVLDTGCDPAHVDFTGRILAKNVMSFVVGETPVDRHGHGTHVCGTVGAVAPSHTGLHYSVAPECELMVGKVLSNSGSGYDSWILKGLNWALTQGADVVNMSLGSRRGEGVAANAKYEALARTALTRPNPVLIIAAAGNDSARPPYVAPVGDPAACESIVAVAAVDVTDQVAAFSCGKVDYAEIDISGPGVDVISANIGGGLVGLDGTSMASPHVAGAAALWAQSNPDLRGIALRTQLLASARPLPGNADDVGVGLVQVP